MLKILLTVDYETYGNGSGNVKKCLINPTERLLRVCESSGIKVTLFVDMCAYRAFRKAEDRIGFLPTDYKPATWIEKQLKDAVRRGHDVQLHLHPQWIDHEYISPDKWKVNLDYWRLANVPGGYGNETDSKSLVGLLSISRQTIENLLKPVKPDYQCRAFRAGAWCIQPEESILKAMYEVGLVFDSTVVPGLYKDDGLTIFDYTDAPSHLPFWTIRNSVSKPDKQGRIIEVPIFTTRAGIMRRMLYFISRQIKGLPGHPPGCIATGNPVADYTKTISAPNAITPRTQKANKIFDFCRSDYYEMQFFIRNALKRYAKISRDREIPIVAIGHAKDFNAPQELSNLFVWVKNKKDVSFERLTDSNFWTLTDSTRSFQNIKLDSPVN